MDTSLILSAQYSEAFDKLTDEQLGQLTRALMKYSQTGEMPSFTDKVVDIAFAIIRKDVDGTNARRKARCQRNRENAQKRWSKRKKNAQPQRKQAVYTTSKKEKSSTSSPVDYDALLAYWNRRIVETGSKMPVISRIDNSRRRLLGARMREYGNSRFLQAAFEKAFVSPYLNGENKSHWVANIDWILESGNFSRVLDGVFNPKTISASVVLPAIKPLSQEDINKEQACRTAHKEERKKKEDENLRANIMSAVKAAERNPHSIHAKVAYVAYSNGTMSRLGICWTPPKNSQYDTQSRDRQVAQ